MSADHAATLRPMTSADHPALVALWAACTGIGDTPTPARLAAFLARNAGFSLVATAGDGRVVGAMLASFDGIRGYFYRLAVDPAWRRRGLATALVEAATQALDRAGADRINIHLFASNAPAIAFWRACGWCRYDGLECHRRDLAGRAAPFVDPTIR